MKKTNKLILVIVIAILVIVAAVVLINKNGSSSSISVSSQEDLTTLIDDIYAGVTVEMPSLMTQAIGIEDNDAVKSFTGLESGKDLEYVAVSEPMMSSQAYSLVLVKVKSGVNADEIAELMNKNIDARKWICVTAEKVYTVSSGDIVCLVMSNEETAKNVYESFKKLAGTVGQEYERAGE